MIETAAAIISAAVAEAGAGPWVTSAPAPAPARKRPSRAKKAAPAETPVPAQMPVVAAPPAPAIEVQADVAPMPAPAEPTAPSGVTGDLFTAAAETPASPPIAPARRAILTRKSPAESARKRLLRTPAAPDAVAATLPDSAPPAPAPAAAVEASLTTATSTEAPVTIAAPASDSAAAPGTIVHRMHPVALGRKRDALQQLLQQTPQQPTLVYTRTKHGADKIARFLERCGIKAAAIHGDKSQGARARALAGFKSGELGALVITDIAARLLDVHGLPRVLNYDLPHIAEDYPQRTCRTGSSEAAGLAISIITQEESPQFRAVRDLIGCPIELIPLAGFEAAEAFDPERDPIVKPNGDNDGAPAPAPLAATAPATAAPTDARRDGAGRSRRDRRGRNGRGDRVDGRPARDEQPQPGLAPTEATALTPADAFVDDDGEQPGDAQPQSNANASARGPRPARSDRHSRGERPHRGERPPRGERPARAERGDRVERGDRQPRAERQPPMRGDQQPVYDQPLPAHIYDDDDDKPGIGNTLFAAPQTPLFSPGPGRRRGKRDPFAVAVVDEQRANIYDERQPDSYRDQWSVLGPDTNRPAWTYADQQPQMASAEVERRPAAPGRRNGPGGPNRQGRPPSARGPQQGQPRGGQPGQPRGAQRHGRSRRAESR